MGEIFVTEVEGLMGTRAGGEGIGVGYGCVIGRNDTKAIAMSVLDHALTLSIDSPTSDMEFVLLHGDCLEMNGFISHLKLPHYVTFQSRTKRGDYNFAFLDEGSKREIRRAVLHAIAVPGYQVPFGSRELPIGRGWGTGGIQLTMSLIGPDDTLKVIDQGNDDSVNAVSIKRLICDTTGVETTTDTAQADIIQSRHRIPEEPLREDQVLVLQVPTPEPLRSVDPHEEVTRQLHADGEYTGIWVNLFEQLLTRGSPFRGADHPVLVDGRYVMNPSPIPRYDNPKLHQSQCLYLFGAGREKKIYAVPPHTDVVSLAFEDYPFQQEDLSGRKCRLCGAENVYFDEIFDAETGERYYQCSDTGYCLKRRNAQASQEKGEETHE